VQGDRATGALAELARRSSDVPAQRTSEVRLVEVRGSRDHVNDRNAGGQQRRGSTRTFDLPYGTLGEPGRRPEPAFDGTVRDRRSVTPADLGDERVTDEGAGATTATSIQIAALAASRSRAEVRGSS
jgi:hypothetical protein